MIQQSTTILLPSCTHTDKTGNRRRESDLNNNLNFLQENFPNTRKLVVDNGCYPPQIPSFSELIHAPELFSNNPSIGEIDLLIRGKEAINDDQKVLKLHARCRLLNTGQLRKQMESSGEFLLLNRNFFSRSTIGIDRLPYIDTRIFFLSSILLRSFLADCKKYINNNKRFEHAALVSAYNNPELANKVVTRGGFYPILDGESGHGRDYDSTNSKIRSMLKSCAYRMGV